MFKNRQYNLTFYLYRILKSGVGISNDKKLLECKYEIDINGIFELNNINDTKNDKHFRGLEDLVESYLNIENFKIKINHSLWGEHYLTSKQILYFFIFIFIYRYGCGDAWASRELFVYFYSLYIYLYLYIFKRHNNVKMNYNSIMNWISTFPIKSKKITQSPISRRGNKNYFSNVKDDKSDNNEKEENSENDKNKISNSNSTFPTTEQFKAYIFLYFHPYFYLYSLIFLFLLHPDGSFLFLCKRNKREWFLHKHFAKLKDDDSGDIILIYPEESKSEKVKNKLNTNEVRCYVCGNKNHYISHHIVFLIVIS